MRKNKKTRSGMTLVEIIISLAIVSIMTLVLVQASHSIHKYMLSANNVDRKVSQQAPAAEVKYKDAAHGYGDEVTIQLDIMNKAADSSFIPTGTTAVVKGETYSIVDPATTTPAVTGSQRIAGDKLNMKFVVISDPVTTAASPAPPPVTPVTPVTP